MTANTELKENPIAHGHKSVGISSSPCSRVEDILFEINCWQVNSKATARKKYAPCSGEVSDALVPPIS